VDDVDAGVQLVEAGELRGEKCRDGDDRIGS
jgi:hypothetical protein